MDVGRSSVDRPKAPHEVSPIVQKVFGLGTTRGAPVVYTTAPLECKVCKLIDFKELVYLMNGTCLTLISWNGTAKCTTEKTFRQEAISSAFLLEVQKNSVDLVFT